MKKINWSLAIHAERSGGSLGSCSLPGITDPGEEVREVKKIVTGGVLAVPCWARIRCERHTPDEYPRPCTDNVS